MGLKKSPSSRSLFGLNLTIFCMTDVRAGVGPFLTIFLKSYLHWSADKIGLALGALDLTAAFSQIPSGMIVDAVKFKRLLVFFACSAISFGAFIIFKFGTLTHVLFAQGLNGIAVALLPTSICAISLGLVGRARFPKRVSLNETWGHAGNVVTAATVGFLSYRLGREWIIYMVLFFSVVTVFFLLFINPKEINHHTAREMSESKGEPLPIRSYLKTSPLLLFVLSVFFFYFSNEAQIALIGQLLSIKNPEIDALFMGASIILGQTVMVIVAFSMGFLMNYVGRKPIFLVALGILALRAFLYTLTEDPFWLLSIQFLDGIGAAIYGVIGAVTISDIAKGSGRFNFSLGVMIFAQGIGGAASNVLAGFVVDHFGFKVGFYTLSLIALIGLCYHAIVVPETKSRR